ncbi:MAG: SusC/RagA family TonB-linked outer membrane protein [Chitinophagaceae bacterium]|nr:SusC/RagA family TonB-linked outer membrane protein [Chitinophagaceae bacterium]
MKLTFILLTAAMLSVHASGISQNISVTLKDASLEKVFDLVKKKTNYVFFYKKEDIANARLVTIDAQNIPLSQFLSQVFLNQSLGYSIKDQSIIIFKKEIVLFPSESPGNAPPLRGKITDSSGAPLRGATISIRGTSKAVKTDDNGEFSIELNEGEVLKVSYVGYQSREMRSVKGFINIVLVPSQSELDQIQVIAYGTTTRRLSTGNISTIKGEDIAKQPVSNPLLALQGRAPGLYIVQQGGIKGGPVDVQVQGRNSIGNSSNPLYIIDGVPYIDQLNIMGGPMAVGSPFSYINPNDIESVDILKDADATSIYGSRAANGAIIITTKKGKAGKTSVNLSFQQGFSEVAKMYKMMNTQQYLEMREEAKANDHDPIQPTDYDLNGIWDRNRYTDWQKVLIGGKARFRNASLSISGGTSNTQYLLSGTYKSETSVFPDNFLSQTGAMHFSLMAASLNNKFKLQFTGSFVADESKNMSQDLTETAIGLPPNAPALYKEDGTLNWQTGVDGNSTFPNPMARLESKYNNKTANLISRISVSYELVKNIELKTSFGFNKMNTNEVLKTPITYYSPDIRQYVSRGAKYSNSRYNTWIIEPEINYNGKVGRGILQAVFGGTVDQRLNEGLIFSARGFSSDLVLDDPTAAPVVSPSAFYNNQYKYAGAFVRVNYNLDNRFVINLNGRRDGSSRFGSENQLHSFASVAGIWIFTNEEFIKKTMPVLSFGKLKIGYGTSGADQIQDYGFMSLFSTVYSDLGYQGIKGLEASRLANPYLQWEQTNKFDLGLDLGFFNDRILLQSRFYMTRSTDQLLFYPLPAVTGFTGIMRNSPAVLQNKGLEISLNTVNLKGKGFTWKTNFNFTLNRNKLVSYPGLESSGDAYTYAIGQPVNMVRKFDFAGVDPQTGKYIFRDHNGQLTSSPDPFTDRTINLVFDPAFYGGLGNSFSYKGFQLDVLLQFEKKNKMNDFQYGAIPGYFQISAGNQPVTVLDRWKKPGDIAKAQYYTSTASNISTWWSMREAVYEDASFIRVKNVALSWDLPASWIKRIHMFSAQLFINAQNLATITNFSGLDPEGATSNRLPPLRTITTGIRLTL